MFSFGLENTATKSAVLYVIHYICAVSNVLHVLSVQCLTCVELCAKLHAELIKKCSKTLHVFANFRLKTFVRKSSVILDADLLYNLQMLTIMYLKLFIVHSKLILKKSTKFSYYCSILIRCISKVSDGLVCKRFRCNIIF